LASSADTGEALERAAAAIATAERASTVQIWGKDESGGIVCRAVWAEPDAIPVSDDCAECVGSNPDLTRRCDLLAVLDGADLVEWRAEEGLPDDALSLLVAFFASRLVTLPVRANDTTVGAVTIVQEGRASKSTAAQRSRLADVAQLLSATLSPSPVTEASETATPEVKDPARGEARKRKRTQVETETPRGERRRSKKPPREAESSCPVAETGETAPREVEPPREAEETEEIVAPPTVAAVNTGEVSDATVRQVESLRDAVHAVVNILDSQQAVEAIKAQIAALVGGDQCRVRVFLLSAQNGYTEFPPRPDDDAAKELESEGPTELERRAIREGRTLAASTPGAVRLATSLQLRGAPLGYLSLIAGRSDPLDSGEIAAAETLAQHICLALDIARLRRSVQSLTTVDTLTGLRNREFLFERLAAELARAKRYSEPLSLVRMDVDDFTTFNAAHGNREGNRLLRTAANLVKMSVREDIDIVCRFGGGEFAILLPNTLAVAGEAGTVAERLRRTIEATQFHDDYDNRLGHVTVSVGVAGFPAHAEDEDDLVNLAGEALHAAKAAGKNRVGLYSLQR
jgi:diguanylate cyclase (GGDEF)-like protein